MKAGDHLLVLKESLPDGWSLVTIDGEAGLVPATYYTVSELKFTLYNTFYRIYEIHSKSHLWY